jgi:hypothetical protein
MTAAPAALLRPVLVEKRLHFLEEIETLLPNA